MNKAQPCAQMQFAYKRKIKKLKSLSKTWDIQVGFLTLRRSPAFWPLLMELFASHRFVHPKSKIAGSRGLPESR